MDGQLKWKREDFGKMETRNSFGEGSSPTLEGKMILVPWDHEGPSALYALNKLTGETIWKTDRDDPTNWSTPLVVEHAGKKQVVMNGQKFARSYDFETGKELWRCAGQTERPVAFAVADKGLVYVTISFSEVTIEINTCCGSTTSRITLTINIHMNNAEQTGSRSPAF